MVDRVGAHILTAGEAGELVEVAAVTAVVGVVSPNVRAARVCGCGRHVFAIRIDVNPDWIGRVQINGPAAYKYLAAGNTDLV